MMKRALSMFCALALLTASCSSPSKTPAEKSRVIVLGIDGGTWTMIEPLMEAGQLPNLKKLYDSGLHGVLESRPPILSPVVWTTIFTGFGYLKHGVMDWKTSQSVNRRVSAIWEILREKKMSVDVFNVPATWPPESIPGGMLSGFPLSGATFGGNTGDFVTADQLQSGKLPAAYRDSVEGVRTVAAGLAVHEWSPWFEGRLSSRPTFRGMARAYRLSEDEIYLTPLYRVDEGLLISEPKELRSQVAAKLGEPYIPEGPGWSRWDDPKVPEVLYPHLEQVFSNQSKAALLSAGGDWDLFLFVMTLVDRVSHPYWAYSHTDAFPDLDREKAKKYETAVADAYRRSDEEIGKFLKTVHGNPYVVIVSDHGFQASNDATKAIGTHNPDGIYLVAGPGISQKVGLPKFIEDVTPTLLYLLGMPVGQDMDGKVFSEVVGMIARKPTTIASYEKMARDSTDEPVDSDTWESLRGLGYVDGAAPRRSKKDGAKDAPASATAQGKPAPGTAGGSKPEVVKHPALPEVPKHPALPEVPKHPALEDWPEPGQHAAPNPAEDHHGKVPPAAH